MKIIPDNLSGIFNNSDSEKAKKAYKNIMRMKKIIISELE